LSRNFEYATLDVGVVVLTTVRTTASATTTRSSITMPLRKNLGFNGASGTVAPQRGDQRIEYSVGW
jgi:hypothetical protein